MEKRFAARAFAFGPIISLRAPIAGGKIKYMGAIVKL
jgi:hypothetical protein